MYNILDGFNKKEKFPYIPTSETIADDFVVLAVKKSNLKVVNPNRYEVEVLQSDMKNYGSILEYLEQTMFNNFNICPKCVLSECDKQGELYNTPENLRGLNQYIEVGDSAYFVMDILTKTPIYLSNIRDFAVTENGIYFIRKNTVYFLSVKGNLSVVAESSLSLYGLYILEYSKEYVTLNLCSFSGYNIDSVRVDEKSPDRKWKVQIGLNWETINISENERLKGED